MQDCQDLRFGAVWVKDSDVWIDDRLWIFGLLANSWYLIVCSLGSSDIGIRLAVGYDF